MNIPKITVPRRTDKQKKQRHGMAMMGNYRFWQQVGSIFPTLETLSLWVPSRRLRVSSYGAAIAVLVYLFGQGGQIDPEAHEQYQRLLVAQKGLESQLSEAILITRYQAQSSYDPALNVLNTLDENAQGLQQIPEFIHPLGQTDIQRYLNQKQTILAQLHQRVDDFKTQNSVLKNSLITLPTLKVRLLEQLPSTDALRLSADLDRLNRQLSLYSQTVDPKVARDIRRTLVRLRNIQAQAGLGEADSLLALIAQHTQIVLGYQLRVEDLSQELLELSKTTLSEELEQTYYHHYEMVVNLARMNRTVIYSVILATVLWTAYWVIAEMSQLTQQAQTSSQKLQKALQTLQQTQGQLVQSEKLSSLGQLVAGIAHEINNPVSFIHGNLQPTQQYTEDLLKLLHQYQQDYPQGSEKITAIADEIDLEFIEEDFPQVIHSMRQGTQRIKTIVLGLRNFSRLDETGTKTINIHEGLDSTLMLLQSQLLDKSGRSHIEVVRNYGTLPDITCEPGQINQVFLNLISNAIDAIHQRNLALPPDQDLPLSQITIMTQPPVQESGRVKIAIADTGPGISDAIQQRIFDPFFTTKPIGQGSGLGLSSSYDIVVNQHQGQLFCRSTIGQGTEFVVELPIKV